MTDRVLSRYEQRLAGRGIRGFCPFNIAIECYFHENRPVPDLPEKCQHCGWNPDEAQRRKALLDLKKGEMNNA